MGQAEVGSGDVVIAENSPSGMLKGSPPLDPGLLIRTPRPCDWSTADVEKEGVYLHIQNPTRESNITNKE